MIRALVTRPAEDATEIARALETRGVSVLVEPLLTIQPKDGASVDLAGVQALLFTSANGARTFAKLSPVRDLPAFAVGDGTADTLRGLGFAEVESAGGNVRDLERLARIRLDPAKGKLLHPAGTSVAGDLAARLTEAGYQVERAALYDAEPAPELSEPARAELAAGRIDWILVFSPRTAAAFASVMERAGLAEAARKMTLVALSDAVAKAAPLPFRHVAVAAEPTQAALLAAVDELIRTKDMMTETTPSADPPTSPRRNQVVLLVVAAAVAIAVVIAFIGFSPRAPLPNASAPIAAAPSTAPATATSAYLVQLAQRLDKLDTATAALGQRLDGVAAEAERAGAKATAAGAAAQARPADASSSPPADLGPIETRLATLEQSIADLSRRAADSGSLEPRIAAVERSAADLSRRAAGAAELEPRLAAVEQSAVDLARRTATHAEMEPRLAAVERATAELSRLAGVVSDAERRLAEVERLTRVDRRLDAAALAALKVGDALNAGRPYKAELALLAGVAAVEAEAKILGQRAESGVPTRAVLTERFQTAAAAASRASAPGGDLWDRAIARLKGLISIRRLQPGDDVDGRLARAELALNNGDLAAAVAALDGLPEGPARALAPWRADAEARLAAERALDRAIQALAAGLARAG